MTSKAPMNALLIGGAIAVAAAVWAGAILLPAPSARMPAPSPAQAALPEAANEAVTVQEPSAAQDEPATQPVAAPAPAPTPTLAQVDPAAFGALPTTLVAAPSPRVSLLDAGGSMPVTPASLHSTPLQSIGATFAEPVAGAALPELGGAAGLDGPADAGLDEPVARADVPEPSVAPPKGKIIAIDASEGTKLDPLRQRNWDLNAVQVIPPMAPPPKR